MSLTIHTALGGHRLTQTNGYQTCVAIPIYVIKTEFSIFEKSSSLLAILQIKIKTNLPNSLTFI